MLHPRVRRSKWRMLTVHQRPRRHLGFSKQKEEGEGFFCGGGLFFYAGKTQPLLLYTKFMEQPKSGANLEIRRVWTCDQPWSRFRSWPAFVQYIEVGGSSIDSAALRSFWSHASKWLGSTGYIRHIPQLSPIHKKLNTIESWFHWSRLPID